MPCASNMVTDLFGRDRSRTVLSGGVVLSLFLLSFAAGVLLEPLQWIPQGFPKIALSILGVGVVGGAIAAANAAWNSGYVWSWLLVISPVFGWLVSNVYNQEGPVALGQIFLSLGIAIFAASVVSTVGYTIGGRFRERTHRDGVDEVSSILLRLLIGDETRQPVTWGIRAGGLFLATGVLLYVTNPEVPLPIDGLYLNYLFTPIQVFHTSIVVGAVVMAGWIGLAMWPASRNEELFMSWMIVFGPLFGANTTDFVLGEISGSGPLLDAAYALLLAFVFTVILGTCGFVLGRGLRWIRGST